MHFISVIFHEITSLDSKFWFTLRTIILNPGQLSSDFAIGKRKRYMRPITLFFLGNLFYFLFPVLDTFNTLLQYQFQNPYADLANLTERVDQAIIASGMEKEAFYQAYNTATSANSKLLLIFLIPLFVPILLVIGSWRRHVFAEHLMFALEFIIFVLYVSTMLLGYLMLLVQIGLSLAGLQKFPFTDLHLTIAAAILISYFLIRGMRKFYDFQWLTSAILTILVIAGFYMSLVGYRWLLFEVTIRTM